MDTFDPQPISSTQPNAAEFSIDCLPPEAEYNSRDELVTAINTWAATQGYAFITRKSTTKSSGRKIVTYACDKSWKPSSSINANAKRKTTTRGTGCLFSVLAKESLDKTTWSLHHRPDEKFLKHNHPPSHHPSAHPVHRQLDASGKATLSELVSAGISPRDIQTFLRQQDPDFLATRKDIYNRISELKDDMHKGQSSIHALINQLDNEGFWSRIRVNENQRVTAVLFAHPKSLQYVQAYSDLLLLDCTYKTNKYQMPLLDMVGVDACQRSFCIAFAFLNGEEEEDYAWALERLQSLYEVCNARLPSVVLTDRCFAAINAVTTVFPSAVSLLCLWHTNKAVLSYCLPIFTLQEHLAAGIAATAAKKGTISEGWVDFYNFWHSIMQSPTEVIFNERVMAFEEKYLPNHIEEIAYMKKTWLEPYKEKLVKAWVDQHMHFGNTATSRVEGIHALLKSYLKTSKYDLFDVWRSIKHAVENQLSELQSTQARQHTRKPTEHLSSDLFSAIHGWVSHEAIKKVEEQRKLLEKTDPPVSLVCTKTFTRSYGLPCVHKIKSLQDQRQGLQVDDFHQQWHLLRKGTQPRPILEPSRVESAIQTQSNIAQSSTQREPSAFERVEHAQPKCSRCHRVGHPRSSKACPLWPQEVLLESSMPHLAGQLFIPPVLAGWSQEAESALASQSEAAPAGQIQAPGPRIAQTQPTRYPPLSIPRAPLRKPPLHHSPEAIYQRYVTARNAWYEKQRLRSKKTNQQYRKAVGLAQRYNKEMYAWCLDYKQMGPSCKTSQPARSWTKEEMMAYIDWDIAEVKRVDQQVQQRMENDPREATRRGMGDIWQQAEEDIQTEAAKH